MEQESWPSSYSLQQPLFFGDTMIEVGLPDRAQLVGGDRGALHLEPVADQEAAVRRALTAFLFLPARPYPFVRPAALAVAGRLSSLAACGEAGGSSPRLFTNAKNAFTTAASN